jgi:hypothetical protein
VRLPHAPSRPSQCKHTPLFDLCAHPPCTPHPGHHAAG